MVTLVEKASIVPTLLLLVGLFLVLGAMLRTRASSMYQNCSHWVYNGCSIIIIVNRVQSLLVLIRGGEQFLFDVKRHQSTSQAALGVRSNLVSAGAWCGDIADLFIASARLRFLPNVASPSIASFVHAFLQVS